MAKMYMTEAQAQELRTNANTNGIQPGADHKRSAYKMEKKRIIAAIKKDHGIPGGRHGRRIKFFYENPENVEYRLLKDKRTGEPLDNGLPEPTQQIAASVPVANVSAVAATIGKVAEKKAAAPAKKAAAPKAPAAKKTPAKAPAKPAAKAPAKKAAAPAKKAPAAKKTPAKKVAAKPAAKTAAKKTK